MGAFDRFRRGARRASLDPEVLTGLIVRHFPGYIFVVDDAGYVLMNEGAAQRKSGLEPGSLVGRHLSEIPEHPSEATEAMREAFRTRQTVRRTMTVVADDGTEVHAETKYIPMPTPDGKGGTRYVIFGMSVDVTDTVEAQRQRDELQAALVASLTERAERAEAQLTASATTQSALVSLQDAARRRRNAR